MGLLVKARTATLSEATRVFPIGQQKENPIEMVESVFPSEWFPQSGVLLTWPHLGTDWAYCIEDVTNVYIQMSFHISMTERLIIATPEPEAVSELLKEKLPSSAFDNIRFVACETNDTWARDHGFISVRKEGVWHLKDFCFNGWGNKFEAALDNRINRRLYDDGAVKGEYSDCLDFVLEGGSIESDGHGTLLVTTSCLLNENRNKGLSQNEIEDRLRQELHVKRILWLHHGDLMGDDTDGHVDTLARFCPNDTIAYVSCDDKADEHYEELKKMEEELKMMRTAQDEPYKLISLPLPDAIYEDGERLPATYANFLVINGKVLMPTYRQKEKDEQACNLIQEAFPDCEVIGIDCCTLIRQHGSLHCSTMQFPRGIVG